jgi:hypothetical protein
VFAVDALPVVTEPSVEVKVTFDSDASMLTRRALAFYLGLVISLYRQERQLVFVITCSSERCC